MTDLVEWLRAQLDEDEQIALSAREGPWAVRTDSSGIESEIYSVPREERLGGDSNVFPDVWHDGSTTHAIRHDPSRVLRDVAAKRRIVDLHCSDHECSIYRSGDDWDGNPHVDIDRCSYVIDGRCSTVQLLASAYSHRPGYLPEWAPAPL